MTDEYFLAVNCTTTDHETHNNQNTQNTNTQHQQTGPSQGNVTTNSLNLEGRTVIPVYQLFVQCQ